MEGDRGLLRRQTRPVEIVAELGTGHGGNLDRAKELIAAALDAGADLIKFQHFYADEIIHPNTGLVDLPGGKIPLYRRFQELQVSRDFVEKLKISCENLGGRFFCAPFGERSAGDLLDIGETRFKIASPELNHHPLLTRLAGDSRTTGMVLSTGVSLLGDIEESLGLLRRTRSVAGLPPLDVSLLHCITAYPSPEEEFNISLIPNLAGVFGLPVGLSDHSMNPSLVPVIAVLTGASMVEKHFTLSRADGGLDDPIALTPDDFSAMVRSIREAEKLLAGAGISPAQPEIKAAARSVLQNADTGRITAILGSGAKSLAPAEEANYVRSNRSIHVLTDLAAGHRLKTGDLAVLRTEKVLRPGLHPRYLGLLPGRELKRDIAAGQGVQWEDLLAEAIG